MQRINEFMLGIGGVSVNFILLDFSVTSACRADLSRRSLGEG
jgi:hypothetical protein